MESRADGGSRCTQDKDSMLRLVQVIDQALGYVPPSLSSAAASSSSHPHAHSHSHDPSTPTPHAAHHARAPHPSFAQSQPLSSALHAGTVQEKWVDHAQEYEVHERGMWEREGEWAAERATEESRRRAVERGRREAEGAAAGAQGEGGGR